MTIKQLCLALPCMVLGWLAVLVSVGLFSDAAPAQVVVLPSQTLLASLPDDVTVLSANGHSITLASAQPDFARSLYRAGAVLVLPAGLPGCLPLPTPD